MKLFNLIATSVLGAAMAIGSGVALANMQKDVVKEVNAETNVITFKTGTNDSTKATTSTSCSSIVSAGGSYLSGNLQTATNVYASTAQGLRIGNSSAAGTIKMNLASATNVSTVVINAKRYSASKAATIGFNGSEQQSLPTDGSAKDCTFEVNSSISYIQIDSSKYLYVSSVTLNIAEGPTKYTVNYNANGGTGTMTDSNSPYDSGDTVTVLANSFTRTNYSFINWNTASDGSGDSYDAGDTFEISSSVTLYAQWDLTNKYTDDTNEKTITWDLSLPSYSSSSGSQVSWNSPRITMVADKVGAGTATNNYLPPAQSSSRFYKDSKLTFTPANDNNILEVVATATTAGYATALATSSWTNATATADDKTVTITPTNGDQVFYATIGATAGLSQVVVYYGSGITYSVTDNVEHGSLNKSEVAEGATLTVTIIPDSDYAVPEALAHVYMGGNPVAYTYENGVVTVVNVTGNITIEGACIRMNPIQALYSKANNAASGEFYGYYVGFATGSGPIVMDGAWGIMLYNSSQDVTGWVEGETIIHVTAGTISIFNGLYEVKDYTCETVVSADVSAPIVHTTTGSEAATDANRLTNATGKVSAAPTKGNFTDPAKTSDIQFAYTVGSHTFSVFYKKAAQTDAVIAVLADSLANETEITIKGFTSWYSGFQLTMTGLVEAVATYTAEDFAQDLLDQTDAVCAGYAGENNHDALVAIWSNLAGAGKYPSLPSDQKTILGEADADESGTVVERAMARYDYLTAKYNLSNFIVGRTPVSGARINMINVTNNTVVIAVVVTTMIAMASVGVFFIVRRRKHQ